MTRYWIFAEPASLSCSEPVWVILSDTAVLAQYWDYWCMKMQSVGKQDLINKESCILDWATVHWAQEATEQALLRIINE